MSNVLRSVLAVGALAVLSACGNNEPDEVVVVQPAPIAPEPVTGKF